MSTDTELILKQLVVYWWHSTLDRLNSIMLNTGKKWQGEVKVCSDLDGYWHLLIEAYCNTMCNCTRVSDMKCRLSNRTSFTHSGETSCTQKSTTRAACRERGTGRKWWRDNSGSLGRFEFCWILLLFIAESRKSPNCVWWCHIPESTSNVTNVNLIQHSSNAPMS